MKKREQPQLTVNRFKPLLDLDEVERGLKIFQKNDQKEVHWEYTIYIIAGTSKTHLLCRDTTGKPVAFAWEDLPGLDFQVMEGLAPKLQPKKKTKKSKK